MIISALFYTLATFVLAGVALSYIIALNIKKSLSVLALLIFFIVVFILLMVISISLWTEIIRGTAVFVPLAWLRGLLLCGSSIFLFYTTWRIDKSK